MFDWNATSRALTAQLANPADVFTLLFLVGGDVVQTALAQNAGFRMVELPFWPTNTKTTHKSKWTSVGNNIRPPKWKYSVRFSPVGWGFTPVVFSFGWVSYAFTTLKTAAGGETLMPVSTAQNVVVMEGKSGHTRSNTSWVIGRLWRDYPVWRDRRVDELLADIQRDKGRRQWEQAGLIVGVYKAKKLKEARPVSVKGTGWVLGLFVTLLQFILAVIPVTTQGEWGTLLVTTTGTLLAWWTASLPQWQEEKFRARKARTNRDGSLPSVVITPGNGSQHAILVILEEGSLNLEDLATGQNGYRPKVIQGVPLVLLTAAWVVLLLVAIGIPSNRWYLIGIGAIGMLQNTWAASSPRRPAEVGLPLEFVEVVGSADVACALAQLERTDEGRGVGKKLVQIFFPGGLETGHEDLFGAPGVGKDLSKRQWCRCQADDQRAGRVQKDLGFGTPCSDTALIERRVKA
jgi:hypothetical protein